MTPLTNTRIARSRQVVTPRELKKRLPLDHIAWQVVAQARERIIEILEGKSQKLLILAGPCSIHDQKAAYEYTDRLAALAKKVEDKIVVVMRVYFEKPRTVAGWKGGISDPFLNGSNQMSEGLALAREIMMHINMLGLPVATEILDPVVPAYLDDLLAWASIGARTIESQLHRQMASGLSMPVGCKNGTDGSFQVAIDAIRSAQTSHDFLGIDDDATLRQFTTEGNPWGHVVLRGGNGHPNYDHSTLLAVDEALKKANLPQHILVDCSHANSGKQHINQEAVWNAVFQEFLRGNVGVMGMMLESNLLEGNQPLPTDLRGFDSKTLKYGVSVTDQCIGWEQTERIILEAYAAL